MKKISVAGRKYTKQDGTEGTEWTTVGVTGINSNGKEYVMLDPKVCLAGLPIGENGMVMAGVFEEQQNNQGSQNQAPAQQQVQSYQAPIPEHRNTQGQLTDAQGNLLLDNNGNPRYQ